MSARASISSDGDLSPYWNARCAGLQSTLWCPTEIACRALASSLCEPSSSEAVDRSQHLIRRVTRPSSAPICSLDSLPAFATPTMAGDRPLEKDVSRKIRVYPTEPRKWFELLHAARRAYNLAIEEFKVRGEAAKDKTAFRRSVREHVAEEFPTIPSVLLDEAVNSAYLTRESIIRRRKQGEKCDFSFRSRKQPRQSFVVQRLARGGPFPTFLAQHLTEAIPREAVGKMASVVWERGRWFLICKVTVSVAAESQGRITVACDPGVRTFLATYSSSDCAFIGGGFAAKTRPMLLQLDKLLGRRKCLANVKEWRQGHRDRFRYLQKRINSICNKLQDLIHDLHKRAADFLTTNFDVILLPAFETSEMASKCSRKITSRTVRSMLSLGHYRFQQLLTWIAYKRGKRIVTCGEAWTSRTDSRTGEIVCLGPKEWINKLHRDVNGPRGIFLRALAT